MPNLLDKPEAGPFNSADQLYIEQGGSDRRATIGRLREEWFKSQKRKEPLLIADNSGGLFGYDVSLAENFRLVQVRNGTLQNPTNLEDGDVWHIRIKPGGFTLDFGDKYRFAGGEPTASTNPVAVDFMSCQYDEADDTIIASYLKDPG